MAETRWVVDTAGYSHLCQSGHSYLFEKLAPGGLVVVPHEVSTEIERGRELHPDIPAVSAVSWAELVVLGDDETLTALSVKAQLGGGPQEHLGECAVIAHAAHHGMIAVLDDEAAVAQADRLGVPSIGLMWIVVEAYRTVFARDRSRAAAVVDDLISTGKYLPVGSGDSLLAWAWENGLLP